MTLEEMLAAFNAQKNISNGVPSAYTEDEVKELADNAEFQNKRSIAETYMARINRLRDIVNGYDNDHHIDSNLARFEVHHLSTENTPEAKELNDDYADMLYSPEGQQALADMAIRDTLASDLSIGYPTDYNDLIHLCAANPSAAEQMMAMVKISEGNSSYTLHPLIAEQLSYNKTAMEGAAIGQTVMAFYGSDLSCAFKDTVDGADLAMVMMNVSKAGLKQSESDAIIGPFAQMTRFSEESTPERLNVVRQLRDQGVIGPESMFYRAFDETGKRVNFDDAVTMRAEGKQVEFRKMDAAEQREMREALKHPTVLKKKDPGALMGKDLQAECRALYEALDGVDSAFIRSGKQFRDLKKSLKEMSTRKTAPNADEAKKFLHDAVTLTSVYIKDKNNNMHKKPLSEYGQKRLDVINRVHDTLSAKLGVLAFRSYQQKTAVREAHELNQANMEKALDNRNELNASIDVIKDNFTAGDDDVADILSGMEQKPVEEIAAKDSLEEDASYFEEEEIAPGFLSDVPDESVTFLSELKDREVFEDKFGDFELNNTGLRNVRYLYERASAARASLEAKSADGQPDADAKEMTDIVAYGIVMTELGHNHPSVLTSLLESSDLTGKDPAPMVPRDLKSYYAKNHSAETISKMINDTPALEEKCAGCWREYAVNLADMIRAQREGRPQRQMENKNLGQKVTDNKQGPSVD